MSADDARPVVICFPGGHATAATELGTDMYADLGYRVLSFSRPGYGRTQVGDLTAAEFSSVVAEVCERLGIVDAAATVGISFGGMQAVEIARVTSASGSTVGPAQLCTLVVALPRHHTGTVGCSVRIRPARTESHLASGAPHDVIGPGFEDDDVFALNAPDRAVVGYVDAADRDAARATFEQMDSGSGFVTDVRQAGADLAAQREASLRSVPCSTLLTASRADGGVSFSHAEDFVRTIPRARLVEDGRPQPLLLAGSHKSGRF